MTFKSPCNDRNHSGSFHEIEFTLPSMIEAFMRSFFGAKLGFR